MTSPENHIFTSESVSEGHPDKVCDQISDGILDLYLSADRNSRVACETLATTNRVIVSGEVNIRENKDSVTNEKIDVLIRDIVKKIGYEQKGFHWENLRIENYLHQQSSDIALGVDEIMDQKSQGAGDQGIMFGFACSETSNYMPAAIEYSHQILKSLAKFRHQNNSFFGPDSKSQVSVIYENSKPVGIDSIVVSTQHNDNVENQEIREKVKSLIDTSIPDGWMPEEKNILINPTGRFVVGGPDGDTGLTGRKIVVDTYGGAAPHGGGAFSGKDQSKVDRSAAYMARYLAKNIVASKLVDKCLIQLSYAIGVSRPVSIYLKTNKSDDIDIKKLINTINDIVDLSPAGIRKHLMLDNPIYFDTASYGHFGRQPCKKTGKFTWEKVDLVNEILSRF
ncbi:MAG: methionine adenosyltransferase [Rickettsiales bacterium]|nr:methionine adenosyltransferase [Rickettsiales bacterium]|tara:strand:+ start:3248 stop:4429 length:1182 start_codon:yes stop_codon:yes gene_type:complete